MRASVILEYVVSTLVILLVTALYVDIRMDCDELKMKQQYLEELLIPRPHISPK